MKAFLFICFLWIMAVSLFVGKTKITPSEIYIQRPILAIGTFLFLAGFLLMTIGIDKEGL